MRTFLAIVAFLGVYALYTRGCADDEEASLKHRACAKSCEILQECDLTRESGGRSLTVAQCTNACLNDRTVEWPKCTLKHKLEYGCCAEALGDCARHIEN